MAARDECPRIVLISMGNWQLAEDLVADAFTEAWMAWRKVSQLTEGGTSCNPSETGLFFRSRSIDFMTMTSKEISGGVVHELPEDLQKALATDPAALAAWEDLTPLARNEWICWTISVKKPETRRQHVERVRTELKEGMRRPCCWIGCIHRTDKPISPSVNMCSTSDLRNLHKRPLLSTAFT